MIIIQNANNMKELTIEQAHEILKGKGPIAAIYEAYLLGQQDAQQPSPDRAMIAAMAMQGLLANTSMTASIKGYAEESVAYADALIAELNRTAGKGGEQA